MASFKTNPIRLEELLGDCARGIIQLPDFQRSWVWDEDRIKSLIASVSQAFPIGALMSLETGGEVDFKPRPIQGAAPAAQLMKPRELLLDGQQRMTSLYQTCIRNMVVQTVTVRHKLVRRWYYIDIQKALTTNIDREDAIVGVPEDRILREDFGRTTVQDLSTHVAEYSQLMFPSNQVFDWDEWQEGFSDYWIDQGNPGYRQIFKEFKDRVLLNFKGYNVPVITLDKTTSKAAVCLVFEKVNTGGKPLDAFELVTAMYAADGFQLRRDWLGEGTETGRHPRLRTFGRIGDEDAGILQKVSSIDFLQAISLRHTNQSRGKAEAAGREGRELPAVSATRQSLLDLPLTAYRASADAIEEGFRKAGKFLRLQRIYRVFDIPYQSQLVPLAAILAELGDGWEHEGKRRKLGEWFWNGVFGELYGSAVESRFAKDIVEVPTWLAGAAELPATILEATFRADRLLTMRSRVSAAYKGLNSLLIQAGARDFRSGQEFGDTVFFDEDVDIHHIFPRDWCQKRGIEAGRCDSIVNKTPLGYRTNRILGGVAPSIYLARLEKGTSETPPIAADALDDYLRSHLIDPEALRSNDFDSFFTSRQSALLKLIERATGKNAYRGGATDEPETTIPDETVETDMYGTAVTV